MSLWRPPCVCNGQALVAPCSYLYQTSGSSGPHADSPIGAWPCGLQRPPAEASSRNTALAMALATFACGRLLPALPDSICLASHICIEQAPSEANHLAQWSLVKIQEQAGTLSQRTCRIKHSSKVKWSVNSSLSMHFPVAAGVAAMGAQQSQQQPPAQAKLPGLCMSSHSQMPWTAAASTCLAWHCSFNHSKPMAFKLDSEVVLVYISMVLSTSSWNL